MWVRIPPHLPMQISDFKIGEFFWCSGKKYQCTDIGSRTVIAILVSFVELVQDLDFVQTLTEEEARAAGWFKGPPYAVTEVVFDEYDLAACSTA